MEHVREPLVCLASVALFADVDEEPLADLAALLERQEFGAGDVVVHQGEVPESFAIVVDGSLTVRRVGDDGSTWHRTLGPGSIVGEIALLSGTERKASAVADGALELLVGDRHAFEVMLNLPDMAQRIRRLAAQRLADQAEPVHTTVKDGKDIWLRPLLPGDRHELADAIAGLSARTRRLRFFTAAAVPPMLIDYLVDLDYLNHFAWAAGTERDGHGVGVARVIRDIDQPGEAEFAVAVTDAHQGLGIGTLLVGAGAVAAEVLGITTLRADVLRENAPMRAVLDRVGAHWTASEPGVVETAIAVDRAKSLIVDDGIVPMLRSVAAATVAAALVPTRESPT